ncbi:hypothetical protein B0H13DRAFT_1927838 [Mycena leptocephala]|nr:hypothetical protein B0H13DRAFT_1927838 [Mycena leptocephala]
MPITPHLQGCNALEVEVLTAIYGRHPSRSYFATNGGLVQINTRASRFTSSSLHPCTLQNLIIMPPVRASKKNKNTKSLPPNIRSPLPFASKDSVALFWNCTSRTSSASRSRGPPPMVGGYIAEYWIKFPWRLPVNVDPTTAWTLPIPVPDPRQKRRWLRAFHPALRATTCVHTLQSGRRHHMPKHELQCRRRPAPAPTAPSSRTRHICRIVPVNLQAECAGIQLSKQAVRREAESATRQEWNFSPVNFRARWRCTALGRRTVLQAAVTMVRGVRFLFVRGFTRTAQVVHALPALARSASWWRAHITPVPQHKFRGARTGPLLVSVRRAMWGQWGGKCKSQWRVRQGRAGFELNWAALLQAQPPIITFIPNRAAPLYTFIRNDGRLAQSYDPLCITPAPPPSADPTDRPPCPRGMSRFHRPPRSRPKVIGVGASPLRTAQQLLANKPSEDEVLLEWLKRSARPTPWTQGDGAD